MSTRTSKAETPSPAEAIRTLAAELDAAWTKIGARHGDLRQLILWFKEDPSVTEPPKDDVALVMQVLEAGLKTLSLRRLVYLDAQIRACSEAGRRIDL